jgi:hypothetical protein
VPRRQARPAAQRAGGREPGDVTDLGDEHRGEHRADPRNRLDGGVAGVGAQTSGDEVGEQSDLELEVLDQPQLGVHPSPRRRWQCDPLQQLVALNSEQIAHRDCHPGTGEDGVDLALQVGLDPDQLGAVADQLA